MLIENQQVYFVQGKTLGLIKIGIAANVAKRLYALKIGSPDMLDLLLVLPICNQPTKQAEKNLHRKFKALRHHGEWFNPGPELLAYIEECKQTLAQCPNLALTVYAPPKTYKKKKRAKAGTPTAVKRLEEAEARKEAAKQRIAKRLAVRLAATERGDKASNLATQPNAVPGA